MQCERCGAGPAGADLFDFCALCGLRLCDLCMDAGCCGQVPAISGLGEIQKVEPVQDAEPEGE